MNLLTIWAIHLNSALFAILVARQLELRWPIARHRFADYVAEWMVSGANMLLRGLVQPLAAASSAVIVRSMGGGIFHLRTDGWWYFISLGILVVLADLYKYWYHRLAHRVPFLWSMHSFHHSAEAITFATGARHYWVHGTLTAACFPIFAILFSVPPQLLGVLPIFFLPEVAAHTNWRIPMGRAVTWINNPQWHRIHHSSDPLHHDKNFAAVFPIWDILFRTAWIPARDEYPATGLHPSEHADLLDGIIWPLRHLRHRRTDAVLAPTTRRALSPVPASEL